MSGSRISWEEPLSEDPTAALLAQSLNAFEICARHAVECVLLAPTRVAASFVLARELRDDYAVSCSIQAGNGGYSASISVGIAAGELGRLLPGESRELQLDAVGEITNILAGTFLGKPVFAAHFGDMTPSLPRFAEGGVTVRKACCIEGVLLVKSVKVFSGLLVTRFPRE